MVLPLLTLPYLYTVLGEARFGALMIAQALNGLFSVVADFGFHSYWTREWVRTAADDRPGLVSGVQWARFGLSLVLALPFFGIVYAVPAYREFALLFGLSYLFVPANSSLPIGVFQGMGRFAEINIAQSLQRMVYTVLVFALVRKPEHDWLVPVFSAICVASVGVWSWWRLSRLGLNRIQFSGVAVMRSLRESAGLFWISAANASFAQAPILMIGAFQPASVVSAYAFVDKFILAIKLGIQALGTVLLPRLSRRWSQEGTMVRGPELYRAGMGSLGLYALFLLVFGAYLFLGRAWLSGVLGPAFVPMLIASAGIPLLFAYRHLAEVAQIARGNARSYARTAVAISLIQWGLTALGTQKGGWGWVLGTVYAVEVVLLIQSILELRKTHPEPPASDTARDVSNLRE